MGRGRRTVISCGVSFCGCPVRAPNAVLFSRQRQTLTIQSSRRFVRFRDRQALPFYRVFLVDLLTRVRLARSFRNKAHATFREQSCNRSSCSACMIDQLLLKPFTILEQPMGQRVHWWSDDLPLLRTQETTLFSGSPPRDFVDGCQSRRMTHIRRTMARQLT
ncbi:hypothetical protein K491DRAFT_3029 [Lophiostoma macrostomum CBS 122681]|uniref:Uncharacterized protein n=1 Tax=Lophiostoma macrostomum CBS 122681 TaxID=1314788 RepID=A0A6A6TSL7_9PLEO|nr:hypothetical protein K491DRAFT_3029 [Lophiostoma macrostomum CBS 122681]